ncbi:UDP-glycosyltransferase 83A1-like [Olea europaea var. sylvestris]|uniref:UDP-glycosyltransferase 83A1-like n=1 Tax=Olea europaea var. sylvestris TaxID=158386 RepID=UPI000C1D6D9F|nr:UDP-glycosyltransferase 83A1-like [Olea europaea var. sylvestris]
MKNPHVLLIPYPAQGHVLPLMEVALHLVKYGFKITFVNSEFIHERVIKSMPETDNVRELINMVSLPDGLESSDDRSDTGKLWGSITRVMPGELKVLIERINGSESDKISCIIAEASLGWAIEVAEKMGIKKVAFWPAASALFALLFKIPSLIDEGIIDSEGYYSFKHKLVFTTLF